MTKEIEVVFRGNYWCKSYSCTFPEDMFYHFVEDKDVIRILDAETGEELWYNWNSWDYWN